MINTRQFLKYRLSVCYLYKTLKTRRLVKIFFQNNFFFNNFSVINELKSICKYKETIESFRKLYSRKFNLDQKIEYKVSMPPDTTSNAVPREDTSSSELEDTKEPFTSILNGSTDLKANSNKQMKRKLDSNYVEEGFRNDESKEYENCSENQDSNVDIFGHSLTSRKYLNKLTVNCPHCARKVGALRFAFHLARCMKTKRTRRCL